MTDAIEESLVVAETVIGDQVALSGATARTARGGGCNLHISVCRLSGERLGEVLLSHDITAEDAAQRIRKIGASVLGRSSRPLVLLGSEILPDDCSSRLKDHVAPQSGELVAFLISTEMKQVRVVSADGQHNLTLTTPAASTIKDVALAIQESEGIPLWRQQIFVNDEIAPPQKVIGTLKSQPLTVVLNALPEVDLITVNMRGDPGTQSQFVIDGVTCGDPRKHKQPYNVKVGLPIMLKECPCKIIQLHTSKMGKNGYPKLYIGGRSIFTGRLCEEVYSFAGSGVTFDMPVVSYKHYQLISVDTKGGQVSLLADDGTIKDDVDLPSVTTCKLGHGELEKDRELERIMLEYLEVGSLVKVEITCAVGVEKITSVGTMED